MNCGASRAKAPWYCESSELARCLASITRYSSHVQNRLWWAANRRFVKNFIRYIFAINYQNEITSGKVITDIIRLAFILRQCIYKKPTQRQRASAVIAPFVSSSLNVTDFTAVESPHATSYKWIDRRTDRWPLEIAHSNMGQTCAKNC